MTISSKKPKKNVNHGVNEKSGVDPPPYPATPTSYRQLICNLRRVHPCGKTKSLLRTHAYCKTHAYYDMSHHNVELVSNYKTTVYKRWVWWGTVADRPPIFRSFHGWHFSLVFLFGLTPDFSFIPWLTFLFGLLPVSHFSWHLKSKIERASNEPYKILLPKT